MGKGGSVKIGSWYRVGYHHGIVATPIDAFLEFRGGDKTAWAGELRESGIIHINAPYLFGGEKDQGGIVGDFEVMFGDADQQPNDYLLATFGSQVPGWRGVTTGVFRGGRFGAMNPYPQKPSYKILVTKKGWDNDTCWYPEKAQIPIVNTNGAPAAWQSGYGIYLIDAQVAATDAVEGDNQFTAAMATQYGHSFDPPGLSSLWLYFWRPNESGILYSKREEGTSNNIDMMPVLLARGWQPNTVAVIRFWEVGAGLHACVYTLGATSDAPPAPDGYSWIEASQSPMATSVGTIRLWQSDSFVGLSAGLLTMNPAHMLYESRTAMDRGAEPIESISDASFRTAADWFYAQGFGLCHEFNPDAESVDAFIQRIEKVAGCSVNRSPVDGLWYLDIANGMYDIDSLPILTDDDILEWEHTPTIPDDAVNSLSVEYEDIQQKVTVTTPPVRALALIRANGLNHDVRQYHELPTADLATRVAQRDLIAGITPTRALTLTTTRKPHGWRRYSYFRLQSTKMGIADLVCLLAEKSSGTLKSGAIKLTATQDIYSLPTASFAEVEPGVDTRPSQIPLPIAVQEIFEAPYIDVVRRLSRVQLADLPDDVGYLMTVAADPASASRDYAITVADAGGDFVDKGDADWCPHASVVEADPLSGGLATTFTLASATLLDRVAAGSAALWDDEIVQVQSIDPATGDITLGRGCADTVPQMHAAGSGIWFYDGYAGSDLVEYSDGESIDVSLLTNTGTARLDPSLATPMSLTFDARHARPYPPGNVQVNGVAYPATVADSFTIAWVHRNRVTQADQLLDTTAASVTPAPNTRYALRFLDASDVLLVERTDIGEPAATVVLNTTGNVTMELYTIDAVGQSMQKHVVTFAYTPPGGTVVSAITATAYTPVDDSTIIDGGTV